MKKQFITSLVLVFALTTIAQPSFAMKRNRPAPSDSISVVISTVVFAARWFLAAQPDALEYDNPYSFKPNHITFVSQSGTHFNVVYHDLDAFLRLSPSIATLLSDLVGTNISIMPLPNVHDSALYVLTEIASGASHQSLLDYIRSLSDSELEDLKKDAELLDSQALKDLISNAKDNPFAWLPSEVLPLILKTVGPKSRSSCASVDTTFNGAVATVRRPVAKGGFGCTDALPVVATIPIGKTGKLIIHEGFLYVANLNEDTVSVIDINTNQVVDTIEVGSVPVDLLIHGQMLYVANLRDDTISVIDINSLQVIATIGVGAPPRFLLVQEQMLYVACDFGSTAYVIDTNTNQVVATTSRGAIKWPDDQLGFVWERNDDGSETMLNSETGCVVVTFPPKLSAHSHVVHGQMLYVLYSTQFFSHDGTTDGILCVIDINTNQIVATIEVGDDPLPPVIHGQMLYMASRAEGTISVIDLGGCLPGQH